MRAFVLAMVASVASAAEYELVPAIWSPPVGFPEILRDVASRLPTDTAAKEPDLITFAHEGTHFLAKGRPGCHGLYIGGGIRLYVPTPPLTSAEVFAAIPKEKRGSIYYTYLRQSQTEYWSTQPLMILDEWTAYVHGSIARRQVGLEIRRETTTHCATMAGYAEVLYRLAKERKEYPIQELQDFCNWQLARCREVIPDWDQLSGARFE
jgi:hypothetical protein